MRKDSLTYCAGLFLGVIVGMIPMFLAYQHGVHVDPFDRGISYAIWIGGSFAIGAFLAFFNPKSVWRWGITAGFGLPVAFLVFIAITQTPLPNLFPLTLILCSMIGLPTALAGAYFGRRTQG